MKKNGVQTGSNNRERRGERSPNALPKCAVVALRVAKGHPTRAGGAGFHLTLMKKIVNSAGGVNTPRSHFQQISKSRAFAQRRFFLGATPVPSRPAPAISHKKR
jgi:hypothetical protein